MNDAPATPLERLAAALGAAQRVLVFTGAGVSKESGIPTFREAQTGLWARYDPDQLASPQGFARDPALVWAWYRWRKRLAMEAQPNAAHEVIAWLASQVRKLSLVTQNVDGLHARAGSPEVIELHGSLERVRCQDCGEVLPWAAAGAEEVPRHACGGRLRPDVVWFGEMLPEQALLAALAAAADCELCLAVGTSALVYPAAQIPLLAARQGAMLVEINPEITPLSELAALRIPLPAAVALAALKDRMVAAQA